MVLPVSGFGISAKNFEAFSGLGIYYPDGKDTQGVGIVPDVFAYPTQKGIADGKDEVLEKAKQYIQKAKLLNSQKSLCKICC